MLQTRAGFLVAAVIVMSAGCSRPRPASMAEVFAGPANLPLHEDKVPKSKVTGAVHHGDKLYVLERWRRMYRVQTEAGLQGWTHERNLMNTEQMADLQKLETRARRAPSQGVATTFDVLNVHTEPKRLSPAFAQVKQGEKFDVIGHELSPRTEAERRVLVKPRPKATPRDKRAERKRAALPPPPAPPKPPDDWEELSRQRSVPRDETADDEEDAPSVPMDDWSLIRTRGGAVGWVLTSRVFMAIPDDVAQYAEGHRIVSYFPLGTIHDSELDADKNYWLWTTVGSGRNPYDFDSFRVFTWNPRRHRYETAYIQRKVEGFLPVIVEKQNGQVSFSLCLAQDDGSRVRKRYALIDRLVRAIDEKPCESAPEAVTESQSPSEPNKEPAEPSLSEKLKQKAGELKNRALGR